MNATAEKCLTPGLQPQPLARNRGVPMASTQRDGQPRRAIPWLAVIVLVGLALRTYHYLNNPPVWHDEAAQIYNVLHKDYGEILGPLYYSEACPPLFLAAEKVVVQFLGDDTYALRLLPFLASCLSFVGLVLLARRNLPANAVLWFALLLGCSDRLLYHASEAKPYAVDVLVATLVLAIGIGFRPAFAQPSGKPLCLLALCILLCPILIFLSFPACFLLGGLALALLPAVWRSRCRSTWLLYAAYGLLLSGSFFLLYTTAIHVQKNDRMVSCWADIFPPWHKPWLVPGTAVVRLTELCRYAAEPAGNILAAIAVIGGVWLWRQGQRHLVSVLLFPIALNVAAWLLSAYPLTAARVVVYAAPAVLLLIAAGIPPALACLRQFGRFAQMLLIALVLVPPGLTAWVLIKPWQRLDSDGPVAFVLQHRQPTEPVVGVLWEQAYYCRQLGPYYRTLVQHPTEPPSLPPAAALTKEGALSGETVRSLWLLTIHDPAEQAAEVAQIQPGTAWRVVERHAFRDVVVLRLERERRHS